MIVEGGDDRHSVIGLMCAHMPWPAGKSDWPVEIDIGKSASEILGKGYLTTYLKSPGLEALGVMLDGDDKPLGRYQRIRELCEGIFPKIPKKLPKTGLIVSNEDGLRLGVWIMPDNDSSGSLETFLVQLVADPDDAIWQYAVQSLTTAKTLGAPCRECHFDKATLYTWLAW